MKSSDSIPGPGLNENGSFFVPLLTAVPVEGNNDGSPLISTPVIWFHPCIAGNLRGTKLIISWLATLLVDLNFPIEGEQNSYSTGRERSAGSSF